MKRNKKSRFINLAAQIARQNDIVSSTMDSLLATASEADQVEQRSDWNEIQKTAELEPGIETGDLVDDSKRTTIPKPKLNKPVVNGNRHTTTG